MDLFVIVVGQLNALVLGPSEYQPRRPPAVSTKPRRPWHIEDGRRAGADGHANLVTACRWPARLQTFWENVVVSRNAGPEPIRIFVTGGTFDKEYDELTGQLYFEDSHLPEMLKLGRCNLRLDVRTLMMIDSLDMTNADRNLIVEQCRQAPESRIVITHGTDTMVETAQALAASITDKTIVLTGAMVPYKFGSSDGLFNLGSALAFVQTLPPGIYVAMNGRYFCADRVHKNRQTGMFEEQSVS